MIYRCSKCQNTGYATSEEDPFGSRSTFEVFEGIDSLMVHCAKCGELVASYPYQGEGEDHCLKPLLLDENQGNYALHLVAKQEEKLRNAMDQLARIGEKIRAQMEAQEEDDE